MVRLRHVLIGAVLAVSSQTVRAAPPEQPGPVDAEKILLRVEAQEQRIQELEAQLSRIQRLPATPAGASGDPDEPAGSVDTTQAVLAEQKQPAAKKDDKDGGWVDVAKEKPKPLTVKGRVHSDYVLFADQDAASTAAYGDLQNYFEFRRLRIGIEGEAYGVYEYELEVDFEPENNFTVRNAAGTGSVTIGSEAVSLKDAHVSLLEVPVLGMARFGHFKQPFSLEELTSANYISFMERGLPNAFSPGRDVGTAAFNHDEAETTTWGYGVFFNDVDDVTKQRIDDQQGVNVAARMTWLPYVSQEGRYLVHVGGGAIFADVSDDSITFSTRPETHEEDNFLSTGALAAENFLVSNAELAVVWGPLSFQTEMFGLWTDGAGTAPNDQYWGAYAYASYFLTGENRAYRRTTGSFHRMIPFTNFWIVNTASGRCAGWGAWEMLARWSYLDLDDRGATSGGRGQLNDVTVGLNWYWTPHTRWMVNYIHAFGDRADVGQNDTDILGLSLRFDF
jgi:phosphate-selective porin OprO/OprP